MVALSGGPDSVALLHLLLEAGAPADRVVAAHLDHGLRPGSREDRHFARGVADGAGVAFRSARVDVRAAAGRDGVEAAGRRARYRWLERVAVECGLPAVATGHHLDDQAETVLLRILRGTGPGGLRAIRWSRPIRTGSPVGLARPLLGTRRSEILRWLSDRDLPWRIDETNRDGSNLRSRVRHRLLPALEAGLPDLVPRLARLADRVLTTGASATATGDVVLSPPLLRVPSALRDALLRRLPVDGPPLDRRAMERVAAAAAVGRGDAELGRGWRARVRRGVIRLIPPGPPPPPPDHAGILAVPGEVTLPSGDRIRAEPVAGTARVPATGSEVVDLARAPAPFTVRNAREGDRFRPLGYPARTTVYRFLMGQRVPREDRGRVPLVLSGDRPVWLVRYRIADDAKVTGETTEAARLSVVRG